jgi:hypothetical protein
VHARLGDGRSNAARVRAAAPDTATRTDEIPEDAMPTTPLTRTTWRFAGVALLALAAAALLALGTTPSGADERPDPITSEPLTDRHTFTDDVAVQVKDQPDGRSTEAVSLGDASHLVVLEITIQPGATIPGDSHPGAVVAMVVEGDEDGPFVHVYADDCVERTHEAADTFVDPAGDNIPVP